MNIQKILLILFIASTLCVSAKEPQSVKNDADYMSIATLLIKDGYYQRARLTLQSVNTKTKGFNFIQFYKLQGFVSIKLKDYANAAKFFNQSIQAGNKDKRLYIYLAQAYFKMKQYKNAIDAFEDAGKLLHENAQYYAVKIDCHWKLKEHKAALDTLDEAYVYFPTHHKFVKQKFFYLIELKLFQAALIQANRYLKVAKMDPKTYLAMASALKKSSQIKEAIKLLEIGKLEFSNPDLMGYLAHLYIDTGKIYSAAKLLEEASFYDQKYKAQSSEVYRRTKAYVQALYLNSQINDLKIKLKQKISIFLEFHQFSKAIALETMLKRHGLLKNENIRYAMAYAYYMTQEFASAERHLKYLTQNELFNKGIQLRKSMQQCKTNIWECQ